MKMPQFPLPLPRKNVKIGVELLRSSSGRTERYWGLRALFPELREADRETRRSRTDL